MTIRVIWLVGFSVEVIFVQAGEASLLKKVFSGFDIVVNYSMLSQMVE